MKKILAFTAMMTASAGLLAAPVDELRVAAEEDKCLEAVIGDILQKEGVEKAQEIVNAAYVVLAEYADRQKELGCGGNIGQAAIAAGADPNDVLAATAAGLGAPGAGGITNLGGLSGSSAGGGFASPS